MSHPETLGQQKGTRKSLVCKLGKKKAGDCTISVLDLINYEVCKTGRGRKYLLSDVQHLARN